MQTNLLTRLNSFRLVTVGAFFLLLTTVSSASADSVTIQKVTDARTITPSITSAATVSVAQIMGTKTIPARGEQAARQKTIVVSFFMSDSPAKTCLNAAKKAIASGKPLTFHGAIADNMEDSSAGCITGSEKACVTQAPTDEVINIFVSFDDLTSCSNK